MPLQGRSLRKPIRVQREAYRVSFLVHAIRRTASPSVSFPLDIPAWPACFLHALVSIVVELRHYIPYVYAARVGEAITAMNLPGALFQVPVAFLFADHQIWRPPLVSFQLWHGITFSIFALVFWWIAGRAAEALVAIDDRQLNPKIGWVETVTGFLIMAGGATILGGMLFGLSPSERDWESTRLGAGGGLWALLGSLSVIARFRQWRFTKKQKAAI